MANKSLVIKTYNTRHKNLLEQKTTTKDSTVTPKPSTLVARLAQTQKTKNRTPNTHLSNTQTSRRMIFSKKPQYATS